MKTEKFYRSSVGAVVYGWVCFAILFIDKAYATTYYWEAEPGLQLRVANWEAGGYKQLHEVEYLYLLWNDTTRIVEIIGKANQECISSNEFGPGCVDFPGGISFNLKMELENWSSTNPSELVHIDPVTNQLVIPEDYIYNHRFFVLPTAAIYPFSFVYRPSYFYVSEGRGRCLPDACSVNESFLGTNLALGDASFGFLFYSQVSVNYIGTNRPSQLTPQVVPEPATAGMLSLFMPFILRRRKLSLGS